MQKLPSLAKLIQSPPKKLKIPIELHGLTNRLLQCNGPDSVAGDMLDALMEYHQADFGELQLSDSDGKDLRIAAHRGFDDQALTEVRRVALHAQSTHGRALRSKCSVLSKDVRTDADLAAIAKQLAKAGVCAVQSTPLVGADGAVVGVISTYFRKPYRFVASTMQVTAMYAQQGAYLLERALPGRATHGFAGVQPRETSGQNAVSHDGEYAPFYRKVAQFGDLRDDDIPVLREMIRETCEFEADTEFMREGESQDDCLIMLEGWGCKYKNLEDGTRQIIHFPIVGDFVGLHARLFAAADHSFATITHSKVGVFGTRCLQEVIQTYPRLGQAILWSAARDEAIIVEHLVNLGRRSAIQRLAHFLLELCKRMDFAGLGKDGKYRCPLTQEHLADALGLTSIHVNRVLRQLRERKLVSLEKGTLDIKDFSQLSDLAAFDPDYLDQSN